MRRGVAVGGRPGVTVVSAAMDERGVPCAVKTLHPEIAADSLVALRFAREIDAHVAATGVHGVIPAWTHHAHPDWLIMAWAYGGDMATAVERTPLFRDRLAHDASEIAVSLLRSAAGLHARGIAHRDIKPSNLLLDGERVLLCDFGIAGRSRVQGAGSRAAAGARGEWGDAEWEALPAPHREISAGTPRWAAPELGRDVPAVTPSSDIYSIARVWEWMRSLGPAKILTSIEQDVLYDMLHHDPRRRPTAAQAVVALQSELVLGD